MKKKTQKDVPSAKSVAALSGREVVACQFQDRDGNWCNFANDKHRDNTIADGSWPIRWLYTTPQPGGGWVLVPVAKLREILILLDNVTAATDSEADYLGQAENMLDRITAGPSAKGVAAKLAPADNLPQPETLCPCGGPAEKCPGGCDPQTSGVQQEAQGAVVCRLHPRYKAKLPPRSTAVGCICAEIYNHKHPAPPSTTKPAPVDVRVDESVRDALALLERATYHDGRYRQMEHDDWQQEAQQLLPRLRALLDGQPAGVVIDDDMRARAQVELPELQRYELRAGEWGVGVMPDDNGTYVKFTDYATLLRRTQEMTEWLTGDEN